MRALNIAALIVATLTLFACGGGGGGNNDTPPHQSSSLSSNSTPPDKSSSSSLFSSNGSSIDSSPSGQSSSPIHSSTSTSSAYSSASTATTSSSSSSPQISPEYSVDKTQIIFSDTGIGTCIERTFSLTATKGASSITLSAPFDSIFSITNENIGTISEGETTVHTVQFCPLEKSSYAAQISITNGTQESIINLNGSGTLPISAGFNTTFAIDPHGNLWARGGANTNGELGDGGVNRNFHSSFILIGDNFATVSAGTNHTLAVKTDGTLWAWGSNSEGQLGFMFDTSIGAKATIPTQVGEEMNWIAVSAGADHSLALNDKGELFAWGSNRFGQIGTASSTELYTEPMKVGDGFKSISAGSLYSTAIKIDGSLWAWGYNFYGQLGYKDPSQGNALFPTKVREDSQWASVSAGWRHTLAITSENKLWAWGDNENSQLLGEGDFGSNSPDENIFTDASAGGSFSLVIATDGKLMGTGRNIGCTGTITSLQRPWIATNFKYVESGSAHAILIKNDGTLWGIGSNSEDQLSHRTSPQSHACYSTPVPLILPAI
jgi:alpha-tubulin suppressor-like RCC1 family protein